MESLNQMKTMSKQIYISPETDICVLRINGQVLQGYTVIDLSSPQEVTEGEINTNDGNLWDEEELADETDNRLWDKL